MFIERTPGLAATILSNFSFTASDLMVVSRERPQGAPVEMAR